MSRARTKASRPSRTFLSWPISATRPSASGSGARDVGEAPLHPHRREVGGDPARRLLRAEAEPGRELEGEQAADRHALAVQQAVGIAGRRLQRMAEGMPEVEQRAVALLGLVARDDLGLHLAGAAHRVQPRRRVAGLERRRRSPRARRRRPRRRAGRTSPPRRSRRGSRAAGSVSRSAVSASTSRGWWKAPIRFLPWRRVDPGLAADRAVDLGEQRRRDLHEADAAAQHGRGEAGEVADDPAAEGDDEVVAADLLGDQPLDRLLEPGPALGRLPGLELEHRRGDAGFGQARPAAPAGAAPRPGASVRTATRGRRSSGAISAPARASSPGPMRIVVGALAERDRDGRLAHGAIPSSARQSAPGSRGRARRPRRGSRAPSPRGWRRGGCRRSRRPRRRSATAARSRSASTPRGSAACNSGRPGRSRTRSQSRSRSARSQTEVACALISARVRGSMKAPPPVASTPGRSASRRAITRRSPSRNAGSPRRREDLRDRHAGGLLDGGVGIDEGHAEQRRQPLADAGLARPHQPDQDQRADEPRGGGRLARRGVRSFDHPNCRVAAPELSSRLRRSRRLTP